MTSKRHLSIAFFLGFIVSMAAFCYLMIPAAPLFIKLLWPFPRLDQTTQLSGRIQIEDGSGASRLMTPRSYVVTPHGRVEFKCGYFGARTECPNYQVFHDAVGDVWHHPAYGAVQWRLTVGSGPLKGKVIDYPLEADRKFHAERFNFSKYLGNLLIALVVLACALWQLRKFFELRNQSSTLFSI